MASSQEMRAEDGDTCKVASPSSSHSVELHSLRKALRELRYQMELFEPVYCAEFHPDIMFKDKVGAITKLQGALGDIHDLVRTAGRRARGAGDGPGTHAHAAPLRSEPAGAAVVDLGGPAPSCAACGCATLPLLLGARPPLQPAGPSRCDTITL
eukprot:scaffold546_cov352-Prasinococcus_capsulatus_cf.AAC.14